MAFAGNCGIEVNLPSEITAGKDPISVLFSEEAGLVIEYLPENEVRDLPGPEQGSCAELGHTEIQALTNESRSSISWKNVLDEDMRVLRDIWEETSHQLDLLQRNPGNIREERKNIYDRKGTVLCHSLHPKTNNSCNSSSAIDKPKVAVIREEGSNGDREMVSAFYLAGFEPWDVTMTDLLEGRITLDQFRGVVFVGGIQLRRRARFGKRLGCVHPVQQKGLGPVRAILLTGPTPSASACATAVSSWRSWAGCRGAVSRTSSSRASFTTSPAASSPASRR